MLPHFNSYSTNPVVTKELIKPINIIIDSKSGYSGAGKFDNKNMISNQDLNFYNYNTNNHHYMSNLPRIK